MNLQEMQYLDQRFADMRDHVDTKVDAVHERVNEVYDRLSVVKVDMVKLGVRWSVLVAAAVSVLAAIGTAVAQ